MAASNEWTEWHLTPRGWERGSKKTDFKGVTRKDKPTDSVMCMCYAEYAGYMVASSYRESLEETWRLDDDELVAKLLNEFGEAPQRL